MVGKNFDFLGLVVEFDKVIKDSKGKLLLKNVVEVL